MAAEVRDLNADKLFKIAKLNLRGRAREWFRKLQSAPADWLELRTLILQKYGHVDTDDIRMKLDVIKQEPKERVQRYFERLDKLFQRGKIPDAEQRRQFLGKLRPEIKKICVVRTYTDIDEMVGVALVEICDFATNEFATSCDYLTFTTTIGIPTTTVCI